MTEADWLGCQAPQKMLEWLYRTGRTERRKVGHFFAACCSRLQPSTAGEKNREGEDDGWDDATDGPIALTDARFHLICAVMEVIHVIGTGERERAALATLLRCVFGNPFRPLSFDPNLLKWNCEALPKMASKIYDERAFELLPILADALQEAGCKDAHILDHCRSSGPHVRGCWVVDLLLGKE